MKQRIQSDAYRTAALRSERYRIYGLMIIIAAFILLSIIRMALSPWRRDPIQRYTEYIVFWIICGAYESTLLFLTNRAHRLGRPMRASVSILNTIVECLFPTVAMLGLSLDKGYLGPYLSLVSGNLIVYCFFIILSTLRLSPALSMLAGTVSALGYASACLLTLQLAPTNANRYIFPREAFIMTAILLFIGGLIAAGVARQIRAHVVAALAEAETRLQLDRIQNDLNIARTIQMGLLPKNAPSVGGYDIAGFSQPADQTGGDYYDWIELPGEGVQGNTDSLSRIMFTIADATGHGIGPALLIAACRAYFRALINHNDPLERITAQVDALIAADVPADRFITAAIALLDPAAHRLSLYSAGHGPLYLYVVATDQVIAFDSDQPPLGLRTGETGSVARVIPLAPGDAIILITDGFFEFANPAGELFGTERLGESIRRHHAQPAADMIRCVLKDVREFTRDVPQADDMTAVVIKRNST